MERLRRAGPEPDPPMSTLRRKRDEEDRAVMEEIERIRKEQLSVFFEQELAACGDMYFKTSRFHKSKKYHAELRGCNIVVFRNAQTARAQLVKISDVIAVIVVPWYNVDIIQKDEKVTRIYITSQSKIDETLMYIKVRSNQQQIGIWNKALARAKSIPLPTLADLTIESIIGRGGGGKVFLVRWAKKDSPYALKVIEKTHAYRSAKSFRHVATERLLMEKLSSHPFILPIQFAFQTERNLFIGTPFCPGGDLASYIRSKEDDSIPLDTAFLEQLGISDQKKKRIFGRLSEKQTQLIAAEIILGLEHLHSQGIVYRDLKPENVFIDATGHIKIGDYGLAKKLEGDVSELRSGSVCGTRNYLPPEMLFGKMYSLQADMWSLGIMIYRMLCGVFPFDAPRSKELFVKVKSFDLVLPPWLSPSSGRLLSGLLEKNPSDRPTVRSIKQEPFFKRLDWDEVYNLNGDKSIPDIDIGKKPLEALQNFDLSKLKGVTVGDYVQGEEEGLNEEFEILPSHLQDVRQMMIGFEYGELKHVSREPAPLAVTKYSGGSFWKLTSLDTDFARSPRGIMTREQIGSPKNENRNPRGEVRSPRGEARGSRLPRS